MAPDSTSVQGLYVNDYSGNAVDIYNFKTHAKVGSMSASSPNGNWIAKQRLYIAEGASVLEYNLTTLQLLHTYGGLIGAQNVTTDAQQNVYVADAPGGSVWKYAQQGSTRTQLPLSSAGAPHGVAVDSQGNVYVDVGTGANAGALYEFASGSTTPTPLGVTFGAPAGMIMDAAGDLLICDATNKDIAVIPPPYTSITRTYSGFNSPFALAMRKSQKQLFVSDIGANNVKVLAYPSGRTIATITGFTLVTGVTVNPNMTP